MRRVNPGKDNYPVKAVGELPETLEEGKVYFHNDEITLPFRDEITGETIAIKMDQTSKVAAFLGTPRFDTLGVDLSVEGSELLTASVKHAASSLTPTKLEIRFSEDVRGSIVIALSETDIVETTTPETNQAGLSGSIITVSTNTIKDGFSLQDTVLTVLKDRDLYVSVRVSTEIATSAWSNPLSITVGNPTGEGSIVFQDVDTLSGYSTSYSRIFSNGLYSGALLNGNSDLLITNHETKEVTSLTVSSSFNTLLINEEKSSYIAELNGYYYEEPFGGGGASLGISASNEVLSYRQFTESGSHSLEWVNASSLRLVTLDGTPNDTTIATTASVANNAFALLDSNHILITNGSTSHVLDIAEGEWTEYTGLAGAINITHLRDGRFLARGERDIYFAWNGSSFDSIIDLGVVWDVGNAKVDTNVAFELGFSSVFVMASNNPAELIAVDVADRYMPSVKILTDDNAVDLDGSNITLLYGDLAFGSNRTIKAIENEYLVTSANSKRYRIIND